MSTTLPLADHLAADWKHSPRWQGVKRPYAAAEVLRLRGTVHVEHSLARLGAEKFWSLLHSEPVIGALGCMSGNQAVQAVQAGLRAIYFSGWQGACGGQFPRGNYSDSKILSLASAPRQVQTIYKSLPRSHPIPHTA